jgi:multicomponent Na+:H+ antiporter subunit F
MNAWLIAATVLLISLGPLLLACFRGDPIDRLVGFEAASAITVMILMLLTLGFQRVDLMDVALAAALLSFGGGLVYARFLERWL